MSDHLLHGQSDSRLRAEFWNLLAKIVWKIGDLLDRSAGPFFEVSGGFDARADQAGWWSFHAPTTDDHSEAS